MVKKDNSFKVRSFKKKYLKLKSLQTIINESAFFLKRDTLTYVNPTFLIQSLKQFIKLVSNIKRKFLSKDKVVKKALKITNFKSVSRASNISKKLLPKPILLYSENAYVLELLKLALKKAKSQLNLKVTSIIQVGDNKRLIKLGKLKKSVCLVVFLEKPSISSVKFCLYHKIYMLTTFASHLESRFKGNYNIPLNLTTFRRCFWIITLFTLI